jgi:predicted MPP superfamily phosphohydrolase
MHRLLTGSLKVDRLEITIADLPESLEGLQIVQLSDFHFDGVMLSERLLAEAIAASNACSPDLVVLTGDFVTEHPQEIYALLPWLKQLQSQKGIYAVLGNHDLRHQRSRTIITEALQKINIPVLWNQVVYPLGEGLALVGFAEYWSAEFKPVTLMEKLDKKTPRIVLSHNPDSAEKLKSLRVDLQLSGHTHGGQIYIPGIGILAQQVARVAKRVPKRIRRRIPLLRMTYSTAKRWDWGQGHHFIGRNQLYVNRGLGTYPPGRLFCPPEVTVLTLVSGVEKGCNG